MFWAFRLSSSFCRAPSPVHSFSDFLCRTFFFFFLLTSLFISFNCPSTSNTSEYIHTYNPFNCFDCHLMKLMYLFMWSFILFHSCVSFKSYGIVQRSRLWPFSQLHSRRYWLWGISSLWKCPCVFSSGGRGQRSRYKKEFCLSNVDGNIRVKELDICGTSLELRVGEASRFVTIHASVQVRDLQYKHLVLIQAASDCSRALCPRCRGTKLNQVKLIYPHSG